ncbi:MAG: hypothetical protein WAO15_03615, partial [Mycobacterium sp.]
MRHAATAVSRAVITADVSAPTAHAKGGTWRAALIVAAAVGGVPLAPAAWAHAAPAPEVEYLYDLTVRRNYN